MAHKDEVNKRVNRVLKKTGKEAIEILGKIGIDAKVAITPIVSEQIMKDAAARERAALALPKDCMTSELVFLTENDGDQYHKEFMRRMSILGLDAKQAQKMMDDDKAIIASRKPTKEAKGRRWVRAYFFTEGQGIEDMPKPEKLTMSELIMFIDDAMAAITYQHHDHLSEKTYAIIGHVLGPKIMVNGFPKYDLDHSPYHTEFLKRAKEYGMKESYAKFAKNECMLLVRLKWRYRDDPAWV
jgi:hypothetical protein